MRYRRGWNGLTQISMPDPEPFHAEAMDLQVFAVPKRPRITVEPMPRKRSGKNTVLWTITAIALAVLFIAFAAVDGPGTSMPVVAGMIAGSMGWIATFAAVNRKHIK